MKRCKEMSDSMKELLEQVQSGILSADEALLQIKKAPFVDIDYAKVDLHRKARQGNAEVIYGAGKTVDQMKGIVDAMLASGETSILITRLDKDAGHILEKQYGLVYYEVAGLGIIGGALTKSGLGKIVVATGGTSDIPVAEEAAITAEFYGNEVVRLYDVGVAGLHRLMAHLEEIMDASVIIAIAGMEGALASVIGGLVSCPVIAVPTSVGYGASFEGVSALLSMLNSCASGVSVVNIDNGFGAGFLANRMNHMEAKS